MDKQKILAPVRDTGSEISAAQNSDETVIQCLRRQPLEVLQGIGNIKSSHPGRHVAQSPLFYWSPVIDGSFLPSAPEVLFASGRFLTVPTIIGWDTNEGSIFTIDAGSPQEMLNFIADNSYYRLMTGGLTPQNESRILTLYPKLPSVTNHQTWFPSASPAFTEMDFVCPCLYILDGLSNRTMMNKAHTVNATSSVYAYHWAFHSPLFEERGIGVPHCSQAGAFYGPESIGPNVLVTPSIRKGGNQEELAHMGMEYYLSFITSAKTGDPNENKMKGSPDWYPWKMSRETAEVGSSSGSRRGESHLVFTEDGLAQRNKLDEYDEGLRERCNFWKRMSLDK